MTSIIEIKIKSEIEIENKWYKGNRKKRKKEGKKERRKERRWNGLIETYGQFVLGCM